ncbi:phage terminase large subunit [Paenibacillus hexagrammi]|uniref:Phage terminase large subunit n=1 Tax=Paenibacillus hexagrammi TaxID=2908839 RepID=A0ABY3SRF3_9BACL|nr:phage terminase large subunit [Paenibacillus sp. YPD9-1]UJF36539.1 phage terminase large subunit [Paenibacillus sp. YPD9-1]
MTDNERRERIDILTQQADIYSQLHDSGRLDSKEAPKYVAVLRELDRLREIEACRYDIMRFAKRYFNNGRIMKPETPSPDFHYDMAGLICDELNAKDRNSFIAAVAPRSHAKSMIGTVVSIIYSAVYKIHDYFVIIGNRQEGSKQLLAIIKYELMNNDELRRDFGDLYNKSSWSMMEIITGNGVKIQAAGSGDALRGLNHLGSRPWVFCDDIEKDPDVLSPDYRDKIHEWFNSTVVPLGSPSPGGTKIVWVGTILHVDSVLNRVMKNDTRFKSKRFSAIVEWPTNMDQWDQWGELLNKRDFDDVESEDEAAQKAGKLAREFYDANRKEMDEGAIVLWPDRMSLYDLMVIRQANRKSFLTEYIGDPRDDSTVLFGSFTYYDLAEINMNDLEIYGSVDPSLGKNGRSDLSAIITIGRHKRTGINYVLDVDAKRRSPDKIIEDIIAKTDRFKYRGFAVETIQFQHLFMTDLAKRAAMEGAYLPIREVRPNSDKWLRIASLEPLVSNGFIRFQKSHRELVDELENVSVDGGLPRNDDRADALELAMSLVRQNRKRLAFGTI